ncbi:TIGR01777 family oxidoreductase [Nocardioides sp. zg-536]|uniref:TIGR01777 family oxidoreductase n=1 Tax=Nocardioides faecalis TaxID=2803858 RepID=A0A938Y6G9_9ACTN|nr:TIGR01777 family oxidoreductase [Nocardioides faecalis]MBM9460102.1 TIGR01777 family oxidoreductase [Nocardioides faecalis]MBS4754201.1 TIGR01777 family oxidoreductase [Nocardioides faecalis]QVI60104.1 TIGR01777 family oxidoreductase [Nocardioides faecalis]
MADSPALTVVVAGASGFLGTHLCTRLKGRGHRVLRLVRRPANGPEESTWDPEAGVVDTALIGAADVVVNLAGAPLLGNVHSKRWAHEVLRSRVATTTTLATTVAAVATPPALLNASGVSWYGDHGPATLTEASDTRGHALLTRVAREWEAATAPAVAAGARVVLLRTAPVQDRRHPPLRQQRLQFALGAGGRLGSGRQHMPLISLRDWVSATVFLAEHAEASGPVNLCAPRPPTNAEFTRALAGLVHRPALFAVPAPAVRLAAGPMADEVLGSMDLRPQALLDLGYEFADPDVTAVLASGLAERDA